MTVYIIEYKALSDRKADRQRQRSLADRLLEFVLRKDLGVEYEPEKVLKGPQGKPYLPDSPVKFNKSHSEGMVAVAVGTAEVGVDCQMIRPVTEALLNRTCSEGEKGLILSSEDPEREFALTWARKEALVKMTGTGLTVPIREIASKIVTSFLMTESHAVAAVSEKGEEAKFVFLHEGDIGE